ncbi:unnamed protein product [Microthlaspi erraticum]|uniref:Cystatin domain-containing protein n=1 Tax=Microthlaspi erraticum TaxID=1685480 RepID=A0A6D2JIP9_9BRAS|nr:unnamed protein product [Microthlaspi erraticum]
MTNIIIFFLLLSLVLVPLYAYAAPPCVGCMTPVPTLFDPHVADVGKFAVSQHNKETKSSLKFVKVVSGEYQVVEGVKYQLVILATDDGENNNYQAIVFETRVGPRSMTLISFKKLLM